MLSEDAISFNSPSTFIATAFEDSIYFFNSAGSVSFAEPSGRISLMMLPPYKNLDYMIADLSSSIQ